MANTGIDLLGLTLAFAGFAGLSWLALLVCPACLPGFRAVVEHFAKSKWTSEGLLDYNSKLLAKIDDSL